MNIRYHGRGSWLANPLWPTNCTLCGADLVTGERGVVDAIRGVTMRTGVYLGHTLVGVGVFVIGSLALWPDLISQPGLLRVAPVLLGAALGVSFAEWSRRRGALLGHSKSEEPRER